MTLNYSHITYKQIGLKSVINYISYHVHKELEVVIVITNASLLSLHILILKATACAIGKSQLYRSKWKKSFSTVIWLLIV